MIPLSGLVNAEVSIWELQDVWVECASFMRVANIEDSYVHSCSGDEKLTSFGVIFWVLNPVSNPDQLTPPVCVFSRQTCKLVEIQRIISQFVIVIVKGCRKESFLYWERVYVKLYKFSPVYNDLSYKVPGSCLLSGWLYTRGNLWKCKAIQSLIKCDYVISCST